jgi:hypothetical protein
MSNRRSGVGPGDLSGRHTCRTFVRGWSARYTNAEKSARIAIAAQMASAGLDADRSKLYFDLIINSLSEAARRALSTMDVQTYEYQSDFARQYVAQGEARGRAALVTRLLTLRFGSLNAETQSRILEASVTELDAMGERLLTAQTLHEALNSDSQTTAQR